MSVHIRPATPGDCGVIAGFNAAMAQETEHLALPLDRLRQGVSAVLADRAKGVYFVAEQDGEVVGQLLLTYEWSDWRNGNFWWIQSVYVAPTHRGQGVFRALYRYVDAAARQDPTVCGLRLYVERDNTRAQRAYGQLGMAQTAYLLFEDDFVLGRARELQ